MKPEHYHVSEPLLLLLFTSAPLWWWVCLEKYGTKIWQGDVPPFSPIAYIIATILATCTASYTLAIRGYSSADLKKRTTGGNLLVKQGFNIIVLFLLLAAIGFLPLTDTSVARYVYLAMYAFSVGHLFLTHFVISAEIPIVECSDSVLGELSAEQRARIEAIHFVALPFVAAAILTALVWAIFRYHNELPNHATLFSAIFGVLVAAASKFRSDRPDS